MHEELVTSKHRGVMLEIFSVLAQSFKGWSFIPCLTIKIKKRTKHSWLLGLQNNTGHEKVVWCSSCKGLIPSFFSMVQMHMLSFVMFPTPMYLNLKNQKQKNTQIPLQKALFEYVSYHHLCHLRFLAVKHCSCHGAASAWVSAPCLVEWGLAAPPLQSTHHFHTRKVQKILPWSSAYEHPKKNYF